MSSHHPSMACADATGPAPARIVIGEFMERLALKE
jgi:hypothetical protein